MHRIGDPDRSGDGAAAAKAVKFSGYAVRCTFSAGGPRSGPRLPGVSNVLYSPATGVAFAHYPKTAGTSLQAWFRQVFPDAEQLVPENPHLPVRQSLQMIERRRPASLRRCLARVRGRPEPAVRLVVGVVREPFEMIVSLYEFWRNHPFDREPTAAFIRCARAGSFAEFVRMAVVEEHLPTYEAFFDVGGPVWPRTRLLDFGGLEAGLADLAVELGLSCRPRLERRNAAGSPRDLGAYRAAADGLLDRVRSHFGWYHGRFPLAATASGTLQAA